MALQDIKETKRYKWIDAQTTCKQYTFHKQSLWGHNNEHLSSRNENEVRVMTDKTDFKYMQHLPKVANHVVGFMDFKNR